MHDEDVARYAMTHGRTATWLYARWRLWVTLVVVLPLLWLVFTAAPYLLWFVLVVWAIHESAQDWERP